MLKDANLKPWDGWPLVTGMYGYLDFYHDQFKAVVNRAKTMGVSSSKLEVTIPHMHGDKLHWIEGVATLKGGGLEVARFINNTPLKANFSNVFDVLSINGNLNINLDIKAPLSKKHKDLMRYFGKVNFKIIL